MSTYESVLRIAASHPALPGHFPGQPIAPGVLLLDLVLEHAERWRGAPLSGRGIAPGQIRGAAAAGAGCASAARPSGSGAAFLDYPGRRSDRAGGIPTRGGARLVKQSWLERPEGGTVFGYRLLAGFARTFGPHGFASGALSNHALLLPPTRARASCVARLPRTRDRQEGVALAGRKAHLLLRRRDARSRIPAGGEFQALRHPHIRS